MADKKKKLAAALAAVSLYLQQEEAMAYEQASLSENKGPGYSPWGQSGNQEMMAMRRLIQLRAFTRF